MTKKEREMVGYIVSELKCGEHGIIKCPMYDRCNHTTLDCEDILKEILTKNKEEEN